MVRNSIKLGLFFTLALYIFQAQGQLAYTFHPYKNNVLTVAAVPTATPTPTPTATPTPTPAPYAAWTAGPNTALLLHFNEPSSDITDVANSIVLTAVGSPVYSQLVGGLYSLVDPGIKTINANGGGGNFRNMSAQSVLDIGTNDFVFEMLAKFHDGQFGQNDANFNAMDSGTGFGYKFTYDSISGDGTGPGYIQMILVADDGDTINITTSTATNLKDGNPHKVRLAGCRNADATVFADGNVEKVLDISGHSGSSFLNKKVVICGNSGNSCISSATFLEMKLTIGDCTTNSGGPGGG